MSTPAQVTQLDWDAMMGRLQAVEGVASVLNADAVKTKEDTVKALATLENSDK